VLALRCWLQDSQSELAERLGTRQQTISEWETGSSQPRRMSRRLLGMVAEESGYSSVVSSAEPSTASSVGRAGAGVVPPPARRWLSEDQASYEAGPPTFSEAELVALWLLGRVPESVVPWPLLRAGLAWSGAGPDVCEAAFRNPTRVTLTGDIKVHPHASAYARHGHATDPTYGGVVLHLVWEDDRGTLAATPTGLAAVLWCRRLQWHPRWEATRTGCGDWCGVGPAERSRVSLMPRRVTMAPPWRSSVPKGGGAQRSGRGGRRSWWSCAAGMGSRQSCSFGACALVPVGVRNRKRSGTGWRSR
jgi:transcriptional regulator with XRE-family HTH domain